MRRGGALTLLWIFATVGAVTLARLAVDAVADEVTVRSVDPLTPSAVSEALAAQVTTTTAREPGATAGTAVIAPPRSATTATTAPTSTPAAGQGASTPSTGPSPTTTTTTVVTATHTYTAEGGSVTVEFSCGTTARFVSAVPNPGFTVEVKNEGPEQVDVEFDSDGHESRIRAWCDGGQPRPVITEHSSGED